MDTQLERSKKPRSTTSGIPVPDTAPAKEVHRWDELIPGDLVQILTKSGITSRAVVDTINDDASMIWLRDEPIGHRSLYLHEDPIIIYRR
jgi:hypothetical protein